MQQKNCSSERFLLGVMEQSDTKLVGQRKTTLQDIFTEFIHDILIQCTLKIPDKYSTSGKCYSCCHYGLLV